MPRNPRRPNPIAPPPPELAGAAVAVTVAVCMPEPPGPVHVSVYVVVAATTTAMLPEPVAWPPVNVPPLAVQEVALVVVQDSVVVPPTVTEAGVAVKVTVGAAFAISMPYSPYS